MRQVKRWFVIALTLCGLVAGGLFVAGEWEPVTEPEIPQLMVQGPQGKDDAQGKGQGHSKDKKQEGEGCETCGYTWSG